MPRTKAQYEEMRNITREKIKAAAIQLFTRKGFAAASVQDIAEKAGISTGLMYRHYKSKGELFGELVYDAAEGLVKIVEAFRSDVPPDVLMNRLTEEIMGDLAKDEEFAQYMVLITQAFMLEEFMPQVEALMHQESMLLEQTARVIERGQKLGRFKQGNPVEMAVFYFAVVQGLAEMRFVLKERFVVPAPEIVNAFLVKEDGND